MRCPVCGGHMRAGRVTYRSGFRESVLGGRSAYRHLLFLPDDAPPTEELAVVLTDGPRRGYRCGACPAVLVVGPAWEPDAEPGAARQQTGPPCGSMSITAVLAGQPCRSAKEASLGPTWLPE